MEINKKSVVLGEFFTNMGNDLYCPSCHQANLHQESCTTFWRESEDSDECNTTYTKCKLTEKKDKYWALRNNPSSRRDGLLIQFECEHCDCGPVLAIYQHKGSTYVAWHSMRVTL
jgi:hypothetical protein